MHRRTTLALVGLGAALCALGVAAAEDTTVTITGCASWQFSPRTVTVDAGDVVTFANPEGVSGCLDAPHTATHAAAQPAWDSGHIPAGSSAAVTMDDAGTFSYKCLYHGAMTGTVVVRAAEADVPPTVVVLAPADGATVEAGVVRVSGTASGDTTSVSVGVHGAPPRPATGTTTRTVRSGDRLTTSRVM